jgi:glycine/D-amino acid oxidase-like deaminating enzyme
VSEQQLRLTPDDEVLIVGQGLAGTCLAWRLWNRGIKFRLLDRTVRRGDAVAAGMVTPVSGHAMHLEWHVDKFLDEAVEFYRKIGMVLGGEEYFYPVPVLRVFGAESEREAFEAKNDELAPWIGEVLDSVGGGVRGEFGGVVWNRGGWLRRQRFLDASKGYFRSHGLYEQRSMSDEEVVDTGAKLTVLCEGSAGLGSGPFQFLPEQRSKGETLTVRVPGLAEDRILTHDGWMIPRGGALFRAGAGYLRNDLTSEPTAKGRERVEYVVRSLTKLHYEVLDHVAEVRPIMATNLPVIGMHPKLPGLAIYNGLGAKGTLYAPGVADMFVNHLLDGTAIDPAVDVAEMGA